MKIPMNFIRIMLIISMILAMIGSFTSDDTAVIVNFATAFFIMYSLSILFDGFSEFIEYKSKKPEDILALPKQLRRNRTRLHLIMGTIDLVFIMIFLLFVGNPQIYMALTSAILLNACIHYFKVIYEKEAINNHI